jgi:diguanylate cyclase (GGDEF)-like protein
LPTIYYVQNAVIGISLISIILFYVLAQGGRRQALDSIFVILLFITLSIIILELGIDILQGKVFLGSTFILKTNTVLFYIINPLPSAFYLLYLDQLHRKWIKIPKGIGFLALTPTFIVSILSFTSLFNGIIFTVNENNIYFRGPLFFLIVIADFICVFIGFIYLFINRDDFKHKDFSILVFFPIPVFIGAILQANFYGIELTGISLAITLIGVFLHSKNSQANKDYLTLLYNRKMSEQYLQSILLKKKNTIAGILMDINNFKQVNDNYGHDLGDSTLRYFSRILIESFGSNWFISRYGGDEFLLLREGASEQSLEEDMTFFCSQLSRFNEKGILPFQLSASVGFSMYENTDATNGSSFIKNIDTLMYKDKKICHSKQKI